MLPSLLCQQLARYSAQAVDLAAALARVTELKQRHQAAEAALLLALEPVALATALQQGKLTCKKGWKALGLKPLRGDQLEVLLGYFAEDSVFPERSITISLSA